MVKNNPYVFAQWWNIHVWFANSVTTPVKLYLTGEFVCFVGKAVLTTTQAS